MEWPLWMEHPCKVCWTAHGLRASRVGCSCPVFPESIALTPRLLVHDFMESARCLRLESARRLSGGTPTSGPSGLHPAFDDLHRGAGTLSRALAPKREPVSSHSQKSTKQRLGVNSSLTAVGPELIASFWGDKASRQCLESITAV